MSDKIKPTSVGGQAVIEGVMMKGVHEIATAVRCPDGHIELEKKKINLPSVKWKINKVPILRGVFSFFESMYVGVSCLMFSAKIFDDYDDSEKEQMSKFEKWILDKCGDKILDYVMYLSVIFSLFIGVGVFMLLPNYIVGFARNSGINNSVILNLTEGVIRILFFTLYIYLISRMKDIQRVFMYHGAEHKSIFCYEHGDELTVENVKKYQRFHPRCGTSFLIIVMIVSIIVFSFISWENLYIRLLYRLLLLPVVAGLSYEIIKIAGRHENVCTSILSAPGMWLQRLTTREPTDDMIEVALCSLKAVISDNREEDKW